MVVVGGPHRPNHRQVVGAVAQVGPPVGNLDSRLPALAVADLKRVDDLADVAVCIVRDDDPDVLAERVGDRVGVRRLGDRLAGVLDQRRLGVEALHVARAADHEQPDHVLDSRREVGFAVGERPAQIGVGPRHAVALEQRREGEAAQAETEARLGEERASGSSIEPFGYAHDVDSAPFNGSVDHHEVVVVEQYVDEVLASPPGLVGRRSHRRRRARRKGRQSRRLAQLLGLARQEGRAGAPAPGGSACGRGRARTPLR